MARHLQKTGSPEEASRTLHAFQQSWEQGAVGKGRTAITPPFGRLGLLQEKARVEPFFAPVLYAEGFARLQRGDYKGAIAQFVEATAHDPLAVSTVERTEAMGQAATAIRDGAIDAAVRHLKVAIELDPVRAEAHRMLGSVYLANQQEEEAIVELKTAVRLAPGDERTHLALANAFVLSGRYPEAEQALRQLIATLPASGRARYALGRLYQRQGRLRERASRIRDADHLPSAAGTEWHLPEHGRDERRPPEFRGSDRRLLQPGRRPSERPGCPSGSGDTYLRLGRHDEALAEFAMTLMLPPDAPMRTRRMAQVHLKEGATPTPWNRTTSARSGRRHRQAHYALGTALMRLGRPTKGRQSSRSFSACKPKTAAAHARELELGGLKREAAVSSASGDHEKAVALLRKALRSNRTRRCRI